MGRCRLYHGDCLEVLRGIEGGSVDLVLTDLPYGCANKDSDAGRWDSQIPLGPLWEQLLRVTKRNAAIVLFAQGMFTASLMKSQPKLWRFNLVWAKCRASGHLNANRMPMRSHEDICVFYRKQPTYNPQKRTCSDKERTHGRGSLKERKNSVYGHFREVEFVVNNLKYPTSILTFPKPAPTETCHPTQKPVDLLAYLIRTYSNPGETVLDATMGSGSTGVAAALEGRRFIGIERDEKYFGIATRRVEESYRHRGGLE